MSMGCTVPADDGYGVASCVASLSWAAVMRHMDTNEPMQTPIAIAWSACTFVVLETVSFVYL